MHTLLNPMREQQLGFINQTSWSLSFGGSGGRERGREGGMILVVVGESVPKFFALATLSSAAIPFAGNK